MPTDLEAPSAPLTETLQFSQCSGLCYEVRDATGNPHREAAAVEPAIEHIGKQSHSFARQLRHSEKAIVAAFHLGKQRRAQCNLGNY